MLVFFALGNAKVLSLALGDAKLSNANGFASQWNIGFYISTLLTFVLLFFCVFFVSIEGYFVVSLRWSGY